MEISQFGGYRGMGKYTSVNTIQEQEYTSTCTIQECECDLTSVTGVQMYTYRDKRKPHGGSGARKEEEKREVIA